MIKNIFFDFDGVLAESVNVKTKAFYNLYLPHGKDIAKKVVDHHQNHGGVSRFEKFKIYHEEFLNIEMNENLMNELTTNFSDLVKNGVIESEEVKGASSFLNQHNEDYMMFIITGTPTDEMLDILEGRKMRHFFEGIFGSPTKKDVWSKHILDQWKLDPKETVFIGDAKSDHDAAKKNGIHFILRPTPENEEVFKDYSGIKIKDLKELQNTIKKIES